MIQGHPWLALLAGTSVLLVLAAPVLGLRMGFSDEGNFPESTSTRKAYDLIADAVVLYRWRSCEETKLYITRRRAEGKTDRTIRRCLKRALARRFHRLLLHDFTTSLT